MDAKTNQKIIDLARKIHELAKQGVGGEKVTAQEKLDTLLIKYGLQIEDVFEEKETRGVFRCDLANDRFVLVHLVKNICKKVVNNTTDKWKLSAMLTDYEYIQVNELFEFHRKNYAIERKKFMKSFEQAYYSKYDLWIKYEDDEERPEPKEDPDFDYDLYQSMVNSLENKYNKKLNK